MHRLKPSSVDEFLARFYKCYDALIREIRVRFSEQRVLRNATITLSVQDQEAEAHGGWVNLVLEVEDVSEILVNEDDRTTGVVLSNGLNIGFFHDTIFLDFCSNIDEPRGVADYRKSRLLIAGKQCTWSVFPYSETASF